MTKKQFKKYKLYVWLANLIIVLFLIGLMIIGLFNESLYYVFLSEQFSRDYLGFLENFLFGIFYIDGPIILPLIGLALIIIWVNLKVFYKDRYKHEKDTGVYKNNEIKRKTTKKKVFYIFIFITLLNVIAETYLAYNIFLEKFSSPLLENLMIIGFLFLAINIAITAGLGISKK